MTVLLLGGTADARHMACDLHEQGITLIYSIAGLVRQPDVPCKIVSGGFTQFGGLAQYIAKQNITAILDITHPYAANMSDTAGKVAREMGIPCWRYTRPAWEASEGDQWVAVDDWSQLLPQLHDKASVLLSCGQVEQSILNALLAQSINQHIVLRTAVKPRFNLPTSVEWIKAIGPFNKASELALLKAHNIDAIISKNSGGKAVVAKLDAARELTLPVFMFTRPLISPVDENFTDSARCRKFVIAQCAHKK